MDFSIDTVINYVSLYGLRVLGAIAIFVVGKWFIKQGAKFAEKIMVKANVDKILISFSANIIYALGITFVVIAALGQLGIQTTSLAAIIGAAGLAIGLALQGSLSNLAAGIMLIIFRPFKVGNYIEAAGTGGSVEELSIFTTTLKTPDNKIVIVPNSRITESNITNYSTRAERRVDLVFGIGYDDDIKLTKELLQKILNEDERILAEPEPRIAVSELADSSVNFVVRPWVKTKDYWDVFYDLTEKVKVEFDKAGISIPFPQQDVYLHSVKE